MKTRNGSKALKNYRGNITAAFSTDLLLQGCTSVPNILLKYYSQMGINDTQMMLLIQILRLQTEDKNILPSPETLAEYLSLDREQIIIELRHLQERDIITAAEYYSPEKDLILSGYDLEPLFEKLSDVWACAKMKEIEDIQRILQTNATSAPAPGDKGNPSDLYRSFEDEFGRPLSPMEVEQIRHWSALINRELILEALRRAVMMGKHNFKYIDSIILEWQKNNLRSIADIAEYERNYQQRRYAKAAKNPGVKPNQPNQPSQLNQDDRKKAFIKSLYLS